MNKILIIGKENCQFCRDAVSLSVARKMPYTYKKIPDDLSTEEAFKLAGEPFSTVPFIMIVDEDNNRVEKIGGFTEYRARVSTIKL